MSVHKLKQIFSALFALTLFSAINAPLVNAHDHGATKGTPKVVVTIKPLHSLVSGVMKGVGEPTLLLKGATSPHHFQLKPSDARSIKNADLIVRVGPLLETPLNRTLNNLSQEKKVLNAMGVKGVKLLKARSPHHHHDHGDHDAHGKKHKAHKDEHGHEHHDDHGKKHKAHKDEHDHENHDDHGKKHKAHKDEHDHGHHDDHGKKHKAHKDEHDHGHHDDHGKKHKAHKDELDIEMDAHIWLAPENGKVILKAVVERLTKLDPKNGKLYQNNANRMAGKIDQLDQEIDGLLDPLKEQAYMVFHDAYQYFTRPHNMHFAGALTINPAAPPSAKHLKELIETLKKEKVACVFSEVQYSPKLIKTLTEGHKVKTAVLDPIGAKIKAGEDAYFTMMKNLATSINGCLKP